MKQNVWSIAALGFWLLAVAVIQLLFVGPPLGFPPQVHKAGVCVHGQLSVEVHGDPWCLSPCASNAGCQPQLECRSLIDDDEHKFCQPRSREDSVVYKFKL